MCLPDFIEFKQIDKSKALIGYRDWRSYNSKPSILKSENQNYEWSKLEGPHVVKYTNSGLYSYNYNYYYYNNYNYNYYYYNYYNNNNYNYNYYYYLGGIIKQWGNVAIHKIGYRSEYAEIDTLFNIRESDAKGEQIFLDWIKLFNNRINKIAEIYECKVVSWQDFIESQSTSI